MNIIPLAQWLIGVSLQEKTVYKICQKQKCRFACTSRSILSDVFCQSNVHLQEGKTGADPGCLEMGYILLLSHPGILGIM